MNKKTKQTSIIKVSEDITSYYTLQNELYTTIYTISEILETVISIALYSSSEIHLEV